MTDEIDVNELLVRVKSTGDALKDFTCKLVFSFVDIGIYKKVENNLKKEHIPYIEWTKETMEEFVSGLQELNKSWGLKLGTCSEKIDLEKHGIEHNKCIDDDLMIELFSEDKELMEFLGVEIKPADLFGNEEKIKTKKLKDKGQREDRGCIMSKDIGAYNTCPHECNYCYANTSKELAKKNYQKYLDNPQSESIM